MIKTTLPAQQAISNIVIAYRFLQRRRKHPLSFRDFAAALSVALEPFGGNITHQTVKNWQDQRHIPKTFTMKLLVLHSKNNWQKDFAWDILAAMHPKEYEPATRIGREALARIERDPQQKVERKVIGAINGAVG